MRDIILYLLLLGGILSIYCLIAWLDGLDYKKIFKNKKKS